MARAAKHAKLKQRTLKKLCNERPMWQKPAHRDVAIPGTSYKTLDMPASGDGGSGSGYFIRMRSVDSQLIPGKLIPGTPYRTFDMPASGDGGSGSGYFIRMR